MRVAADLHGNLAAQAAEGDEIPALGGLGQFPPDMELGWYLPMSAPKVAARRGAA